MQAPDQHLADRRRLLVRRRLEVRTDRVPGELDTAKNGLVRVYDGLTNATYFFIRGDERRPDTNRVMRPGVPGSLCWDAEGIKVQPVALPRFASHPDDRPFVIHEQIDVRETAAREARAALEKAKNDGAASGKLKELEMARAVADTRLDALKSLLEVEKLEQNSPQWHAAAAEALALQRKAGVLEAKLALERALNDVRDAEREYHSANASGADKEAVAKAEAEKMKKELEEAGGKVSLK